jgi:hypothetical protein
MNCHIKVGITGCLSSVKKGVRDDIEDGLATSDKVVLNTGELFLFSHKKVLFFSSSIFMFVKDILSVLPLPLCLASESLLLYHYSLVD